MRAISSGDNAASNLGPLLALSTGLRTTGWAVMDRSTVFAAGVAGLRSSRSMDPAERIAYQVEALSAIAAKWQTDSVVRSRSIGIHRLAPVLDQLSDTLDLWSDRLGLRMSAHNTDEVRSALTGQYSPSEDAHCYAVMLRMGLIGQWRATAEWEAIGVGYYHLELRAPVRDRQSTASQTR